MLEQGEDGQLRLTRSSMVTVFGLLLGIGGSVLYIGSALRQIDVNSARISEIEQHGTAILQTLRTQVQGHEVKINEIQTQFRSREFWEQLERRITALEAAQRRPEQK
jgi:hypothetical protein